MSKIRCAVIGAGHFGAFHADKYAALENAELVAVVDRDQARAEEIAARHGVEAQSDYRKLLGRIDAVSVAVPTGAHFQVAHDCLKAGVHVLLEKPMTATIAEADTLIKAAGDSGTVLQVGHLERFALEAAGVLDHIRRPLYIECNRIAPFSPRSTDVSVIYDLMIHDIDMVLALVPSALASVDAVGAPVLTALEDIANTRLTFEDGCTVNITASRISNKKERKMRIFQPSGYLSVDFLDRKVVSVSREPSEFMPFTIEDRTYEKTDTLMQEIKSFLSAVDKGTPVAVTGAEGRRALAAAADIEASLRRHRLRVQEYGL